MKTNRFDIKALAEMKLKSMKIVHRWVIQFFQTESCFENLYSIVKQRDYFLDLKLVNEVGIPTAVITTQRSFDYFRNWLKRINSSLKVTQQTFTDCLSEIGITEKRTQIKKASGEIGRGKCIRFSERLVEEALSKFYKSEIKVDWVFTNPDLFQRMKQKYHLSEFMFH